MKAAIIVSGKRVALQQVRPPRIGSGEILVKMEACGVCGTDLEKVRGEATTPQVLGHEVAGDVFQIGGNCRQLSEGDSVVVHHHASCGKCHYCVSGSETMCEDFPRHNLDPCGFAEYFRVPAELIRKGACMELPSGLTFEEGTFAEPLGCCLRSLTKTGVPCGATVLVMGAGPMGLLLVQLARFMGASETFAADVSPYRLELAEKLGARPVNLSEQSLSSVGDATGGRGADLTIVATSNVNALGDALGVTRKGGTVNLFGMPPPAAQMAILPNALFMHELNVIPSYSTTEKEMMQALGLLRAREIRVEPLITHRFPLSEVEHAFAVAADSAASAKVLVKPD